MTTTLALRTRLDAETPLRSAAARPTAAPRKPHVALVIRLLHERSGGAERLYCELANMLHEDGHEVSCIYFDDTRGEPFFALRPGITRVNLATPSRPLSGRAHAAKRKLYNLATRALTFPPLRRLAWSSVHGRFQKQLHRYFKSARPDVAISFMPPANTPSLLAARGTGVKVIPTNHNVPEEDYLSPQRWDPNPLDRKLRLSSLSNAAAIHVLFPGFAKWFPKHLQSKIIVVPNYVSPDILAAAPRRQREKIVLAVGRIAAPKNYLCLVEAWARLADRHPDWQVHIYGVGPQTRLIREAIAEKGLAERVLLKGHSKDLQEVYTRSAILCHPALFEGFGLSVAEALALETPVVAFSDCAGVNEFVADGENGLLVDRDGGAAALAEGLERLIADDQLRLRLGRNGPDSVAHFTQERYRRTWLDAIAEVTAR